MALRDRDTIYGHAFLQRVKGMEIREVLTAPQSPWQNPFVERLIGSIRRECLDHVLVLSERHLRRILIRNFVYYHEARTHLALEKEASDMRPIERPEVGKVVQIPEVDSGLWAMFLASGNPLEHGRRQLDEGRRPAQPVRLQSRDEDPRSIRAIPGTLPRLGPGARRRPCRELGMSLEPVWCSHPAPRQGRDEPGPGGDRAR